MMKQILQDLKSGETNIVEVPEPTVQPGHLLISNRASVISLGTERMLVEFGEAGWLEKARQQPEKVREVINKVKTDGIIPTFQAIQSKLGTPLPLGYSSAGEVVAVGEGVNDFKIGDRVASNGQHAETVLVPKNLCAKIPEGVTDTEGAFAVIGSIALQGVRLAEPTLGETFVVIGLGLVGLSAVQILLASGCKVIGIDLNKQKVKIAEGFGAIGINMSNEGDPVHSALLFTDGKGIDGVIIAAATDSDKPVHQAAKMSRKRGRIILTGVTGLQLNRSDFYEKELTFQVSCSYGPGRYDPEYEEKGLDYPFGFVRWTEQRNIEAILELISQNRFDVGQLVTHKFAINEAQEAYRIVRNNQGARGVVLTYPPTNTERKNKINLHNKDTVVSDKKGTVSIGVIGAGNYTGKVLLPALSETGAHLKYIASRAGVNSTNLGKKYGFEYSVTDTEDIFQDPEVDAIIITTRHDTHAELVEKSIESGKPTFVEKPLAISQPELDRLVRLFNTEDNPQIMVGFNRRFSPFIKKVNELLSVIREPRAFIMTVNAGYIPKEHWIQDPDIGGGRVIGEACHFIDLLRFLADSKITNVDAVKLGKVDASGTKDDKVSITLQFGDGSIGTIHYFANGHKSFPKERLEVFTGGKILQLNNFRKMKGFGWKDFKKFNKWRQDKGHKNCVSEFINSVKEGDSMPISLEEIIDVTQATLDAQKSAK